jgi:hypothetical protein
MKLEKELEQFKIKSKMELASKEAEDEKKL